MTSHPWRSWRAQTPSADFAGRTVERILRDRDEHHVGRALPNGVRASQKVTAGARRWVTLTAAAALLIAGGAWAWTTLPRGAKSLVVLPEPTVVKLPDPPRLPSTATKPPDSVPDPPHKTPAAPVLPTHRRKEALPAPSPLDAGRRVIVPRCNCQEGLCDCLEQH